MANSLALYFAKMNQSMPLDRISLCDPFDYKRCDREIGSSQIKEKRHPKTLTYSKTAVNSESDLVYIRRGVSQSSLPSKNEDYQIPSIGNVSKSIINDQKPISIGSKTYFMPHMIIACENISITNPKKTKK